MSTPREPAAKILDRLPPLPLPESLRRSVFRRLKLSPQQTTIAELMLRDAGNAEIEVILDLSEGTVKTQQARIFSRTGTHSRMQLAMRVLAVSHEIGDDKTCHPSG